jgi:hypothetical protein
VFSCATLSSASNALAPRTRTAWWWESTR